MGEISRARLILLNKEKKALYDEGIKSELDALPEAAGRAAKGGGMNPADSPSTEKSRATTRPAGHRTHASRAGHSRKLATKRAKKKQSDDKPAVSFDNRLYVAAGIAIALVMIAFILIVRSGDELPEDPKHAQAQNERQTETQDSIGTVGDITQESPKRSNKPDLPEPGQGEPGNEDSAVPPESSGESKGNSPRATTPEEEGDPDRKRKDEWKTAGFKKVHADQNGELWAKYTSDAAVDQETITFRFLSTDQGWKKHENIYLLGFLNDWGKFRDKQKKVKKESAYTLISQSDKSPKWFQGKIKKRLLTRKTLSYKFYLSEEDEWEPDNANNLSEEITLDEPFIKLPSDHPDPNKDWKAVGYFNGWDGETGIDKSPVSSNEWQFDFSNEFKFKLSNRPHYREDELETDTWWPRTEGENYNDIMVRAVLDKLQEKP